MTSEAIVVFDIGGTWFRSAIHVGQGKLELVSKRPAYNYKNTPHKDPAELQYKLIEYLVEQVDYLRSQRAGIEKVSISMGAALNGHTGEILNSGPLWGPKCKKFDLLGHLEKERPDIEWMVINDVSAALLRYVNAPQNIPLKRISLITISSGIACRTYDQKQKYIPLNSAGIQGEIGHIPISFSLFGDELRATCDCGGTNHLNAFASGRGIERLLANIQDFSLSEYAESSLLGTSSKSANVYTRFIEALKSGDTLSNTLLDAVTYPVAKMIVHMLTVDPEIEKIIITGGVVHSIEEQYLQSLLSNLEKSGLYQVPAQANFFAKIIESGINDDNSGLLGAGVAYVHKGA